MTKIEHRRTVLACVAGAATLVGASVGDAFPYVHAIAGCIGDGSGTCHLLIAQHGHLWFLHVLGSY